jgi:hypothetical protein
MQKEMAFFQCSVFSSALQNVLGWNVFRVYYDNSPLLRIMYSPSLPPTVYWPQNHGRIITIVPWMWCAENATKIHCFSFHCFSMLTAANNPCEWIVVLYSSTTQTCIEWTYKVSYVYVSGHSQDCLSSLVNISTLFFFCYWPLLSQFPAESSVSHLTHTLRSLPPSLCVIRSGAQAIRCAHFPKCNSACTRGGATRDWAVRKRLTPPTPI